MNFVMKNAMKSGGMMPRKVKSCYGCPAESTFDYETGAKRCLLNYDRERQVLIVYGVIVYKYSPKTCCHKPKTVKEYFKRLNDILKER